MDKKKQALLVAALLLSSCCLRAPITGVGSMISLIQEETGLANSAAGMLTTIPLLAFAAFSLFVGKAGSRFGAGNVMLWGLAITGAGILCRSYGGMGGLFAGTVIIGIGIAVGNVLIPAYIKGYLPGREGIMTGVYTSLMAIFSGIAGAVSVPLSLFCGWKNALAVWIFLLAVTLVFWLPSRGRALEGQNTGPGGGPGSLVKNKMTWLVALYMGIQSLLFYCFVAWLATIVQSKGFDAETAGYFNSAYLLVGIPGSLIFPIAAGGRQNQSGLAAGVGVLYACGMIAMVFAQNTWMLMGAILCCGFCAGASLSFAMLLFGRHTKNAADASTLSGFAQSAGYLLAAVGPALMGELFDRTGSWTVPMLALVVMTGALIVLGGWTGAGQAFEK